MVESHVTGELFRLCLSSCASYKWGDPGVRRTRGLPTPRVSGGPALKSLEGGLVFLSASIFENTEDTLPHRHFIG